MVRKGPAACMLLISLVLPPRTDAVDCNNNSVEDATDISSATSQDCNSNGIPDECDTSAIAHWPFDETTGPVALDSVSSRIAPLFNFVGDDSQWVAGNVGNAIKFDGIEEHVDFPYTSELNPSTFSFSVWVRVTGGQGNMRGVISSRSTAGGVIRGFILYAASNNIWQFWIGSNTVTNLLLGPAVPLNTWTHVAVTYDASTLTMRLYINGTQVDARSSTVYVTNNASPLRIGAAGSANSVFHHLPGQVDDLQMYKRVLNASEVLDLFNNPGKITDGDCNNNAAPDDCDVLNLTSDDCNGNSIPDECEPDCNSNGTPDLCDISGGSPDCNANKVPDDCEPDCNSNGVADDCDITNLTSDDCDGNGIPDECQPDCDNNGTPDACEPGEFDCNNNGVPDSCDIDLLTSTDCNTNGVPDECDIVLAAHYKLDEAAFLTATDSVALRNGRLKGYAGGPSWQAGKINNALGFNGTTDHIELPYSATFNPETFSVSVWAKVTGGQGAFRAVVNSRLTQGAVTRGYIFYAASNDTWQFWLGNGSAWTLLPGPAIQLNTWTHLAGTYNATTDLLTFYVNGVAVGSTTSLYAANTTGPLRIGAGGNPANASFRLTGAVDDVQIYKTALPADRIAQMFANPGFSLGSDCNGNNAVDVCDVTGGGADCDGNFIPDECEPDCNSNLTPDLCDISGGSPDCNNNQVPDDCDPDCNSNGIADECDVVALTSPDCDGNLVPDECDPDCNTNLIPDACEPNLIDCNGNKVPDECDIAFGPSTDCDGNGLPDECDARTAAHWPMDETTGFVAKDIAGLHSGNLVGYSNLTSQWVAGLTGNALSFGGINNYVQVPYSTELNPQSFSVAAWARPTGGQGTFRSVVTSQFVSAGLTRGYILYVASDNKWQFWVGNGLDWIIVVGPTVTLNTWTHVVGSFDSSLSTASLHINGALVGTFPTLHVPNTSGPLRIGAGGTPSSVESRFVGLIDDVQVHNAPLPATEIATLFNNPGRAGSGDCIGNGVPNACDVTGGSADCNADQIPDTCARDCNSNGQADACETPDCNNNEIPDDCEIDIASGAPGGPFFCNPAIQTCDDDCNINGLPDACEGPETDCNNNGVPDICDVDNATSPDCNNNDLPDECDVVNGNSFDIDGNGVPDECEPFVAYNITKDTTHPTITAAIAGATNGDDLIALPDAFGAEAIDFDAKELALASAAAISKPVASGGIVLADDSELNAATGEAFTLGESLRVELLDRADINANSFEATADATIILESGAGLDVSVAVPATLASDSQLGSSSVLGFTSTLAHSGTATLAGGTLAPTSLTNTGTIVGFGTLATTATNDNDVTVQAEMQITQDYINNGTTTIQSGVLTVLGTLTDNGTIIGNSGGGSAKGAAPSASAGTGLTVIGDYNTGAGATLQMPGSGLTVKVGGDFNPAINDNTNYDMAQATLQLVGLAASSQTFEVMSKDIGADAAGLNRTLAGHFPVGTLRIGPTPATVDLVDNHDNDSQGQGSCEAVYVNTLIIDPGATLNLGSCRIYYVSLTNNGTVTGQANLIPITTGPQLLSAVSRKVHGGAGTFDVAMGVAPATGEVESRAGGPSRIVITFDADVLATDGTLNAGDEIIVTTTPPGAINLSNLNITGPVLSFDVTGVPDRSCVSVSLTGLAEDVGGSPGDPVSNLILRQRALTGDASNSGRITSADVNLAKSLAGATTPGTFRADLNADGVVNATDAGLIRAATNSAPVSCP